jgi:hypothetical protein
VDNRRLARAALQCDGWGVSLFSAIKSFFAAQQIADRETLAAFLESRSAYLVQKSISEYVQARANRLFSTLMSEQTFIDAYERARWRSFPPAFSMVAEMAEGFIREETGAAPGAIDAALLDLARQIFAGFPAPAGEPDDFWPDAAERLERDLAQAALAAPKPVRNIPYSRAREIFDALPVHSQISRHDFAMFQNTLRFHLTEIRAEFEERADAMKLVAALAA